MCHEFYPMLMLMMVYREREILISPYPKQQPALRHHDICLAPVLSTPQLLFAFLFLARIRHWNFQSSFEIAVGDTNRFVLTERGIDVKCKGFCICYWLIIIIVDLNRSPRRKSMFNKWESFIAHPNRFLG